MKDITLELLCELSVVDVKNEGELLLFESAVNKLELLSADYLTLRDLCGLSGCRSLQLKAVLLCMFAALHEGSVCLSMERESVESRIRAFCPECLTLFPHTAEEELELCPELVCVIEGSDPYNPLDEASFRPLILQKRQDAGRLYFQKYYMYEKKLEQGLLSFINRDEMFNGDPGSCRDILDEILIQRPVCLRGQPAEVNPDQLLALLLPLLNPLVIISGGPGTGKTTIVVNLVRAFLRTGVAPERIAVGAPTGRAARRLTEALQDVSFPDDNGNLFDDYLYGMKGVTIHRLLKYRPAMADFQYNEFNQLPADVVIIDEVSMVDVVVLGRLFDAIQRGARIILIGDRNQLPSVDAGAVLAHLIPEESMTGFSSDAAGLLSGHFPDAAERMREFPAGISSPLTDRVVILRRSYRSGEDIRDTAESINAGLDNCISMIPLISCKKVKDNVTAGIRLDISWPESHEESGVYRIEPGCTDLSPYNELHGILFSWAREQYLGDSGPEPGYRELVRMATGMGDRDESAQNEILQGIFSRMEGTRILCPGRTGISGSRRINDIMSGYLAKECDPESSGKFFSGASIMITRNDYTRNLFNGDVGVILNPGNGQCRAFFRAGGSFVNYPVEALPAWDWAWAITVHKSQGSEYGRVLLIIDEAHERLLTREIVYTGLTRARHSAVIYGKRDVVRAAVSRRIKRDSGLRLTDMAVPGR